MSYLEFLKEFEIRSVLFMPNYKRNDWTPRKDNEWDIMAFGYGNSICGLVNAVTNKGNPHSCNYRIKTKNDIILTILKENKISEYVYSQPIKTFCISTQSIQNILWILYNNKEEE